MRNTLTILLLSLGMTTQAEGVNTIAAKKEAERVEYNPMLFGGFIEHFDTQIYGGIFDPGNPLSDEDGFRTDVIEALKEIKMPIVRWPGGCFVSTYHWLEGVGPDRQPVYDKTWQVESPVAQPTTTTTAATNMSAPKSRPSASESQLFRYHPTPSPSSP